MTITLVHQDIFTIPAEAIVNTVNCVGVMGAGLALQFKNKHPQMFAEYKSICFRPGLVPGGVWVYKVPSSDQTKYKYVLNVATKDHWRDPSKIQYVEHGIKTICQVAMQLKLKHIAVPLLGAGLGGLNKQLVTDLLVREIESFSSENSLTTEFYITQ